MTDKLTSKEYSEIKKMTSIMPRCKTCSHWKRNNNYGDGVCSKIDEKIYVELITGWEGGYVSYIETNEDFGCTSHNEE